MSATRIGIRVLFVIYSGLWALAENPCAGQHPRALVMGGGGSKGAFQVGAAYHLIVHRRCDFIEISGISAGALNGSILAQALRSEDPSMSIDRLSARAESLASLWESFRGTQDIVKNRRLAAVRMGLFGLEGLKNFSPLYKLLQEQVSTELLQSGREFRVGTVAFHDGSYREIIVNEDDVNNDAIDYIFASAIIPIFGTMPRLFDANSNSTLGRVQFGDGSVRHIIPISSYVRNCRSNETSTNASLQLCEPQERIPPHPRIEQIFVVSTSSYDRERDELPANTALFKKGTKQITDGRKIMGRAIDLIMDTIVRSDLTGFINANEALEWRDLHGEAARSEYRVPFPFESYNIDTSSPDRPSRPYELALIFPNGREEDMNSLLDFAPQRIAVQLYCGCVAADTVMHLQYGLESLSNACEARFSPHSGKTQRHDLPLSAEHCGEQRHSTFVSAIR